MNISVVLCTYNRAELLGETLRSLSQVRIPPGLTWEVIVVDNNSADHTRAVVEKAAATLPCRYLFEPRQGKSFAVNAAIPLVDGSEMIAFTDDDVTMDPEWLASLWKVFSETDCEAVGGRVVPVWKCPKPSWYSDRGPHALMAGVVVDYNHGDGVRPVRSIEMFPFGANMAFRKGIFTRYGKFRTDLGPQGTRLMRGEDTDFCGRIIDGGGAILYIGDSVVYHPVDERRARKSYFQSWYYYFGRKQVLIESHPTVDHVWFGIPRYLVREFLFAAANWVLTMESKRRFYCRLQCWRIAGQMAEFRDPIRVEA